MHIAMIGQKGIPAKHGGVERHVHELSVRLVDHGFHITAYARPWYTGLTGTQTIEGVAVTHLPSIKTKHLDTISHAFVATIHAMKNKANVIHYHGVGPSLVAWIPRVFAPKTKVVSTFHSIDRKHEKWNAFARMILRMGEWASCRFAHETITVSEGIQTYTEVVYGTKSHLIPNAVPAYVREEYDDKLATWELEKNEYVLLVSRLIPCKGIHYLIDAWKNLGAAVGNKKLVIVGDGFHTDAYVERLHTLAEDTKSIAFTGFQSGETLAQLYSHAVMKVHPSDNEGLPLAVLEAMSYGLPVLASDIDGHKNLVKHPDFTFEAGSVAHLQEKLADMLHMSSLELEKEGLRNRKKVRSDYGWEQAVQRISALYRGQQSTSHEQRTVISKQQTHFC